MIIEYFNTGPHRATLVTGEDRNTQSGTGILGGLRNTWIGFLLSPLSTETTIDVGTAGLIVSIGAKASHTLELLYGKEELDHRDAAQSRPYTLSGAPTPI